MNYSSNITPEEIKDLELKSFGGSIILVDTVEKISEAVSYLSRHKLLGFDTETKPTFKKGRKNKVSLLQLSTESKAYLFRINKIGLPPALTNLLSDPSIIKTGVAIHDDIKMLASIQSFRPSGFVDLQKTVKDFGIESSALKKLTAIVLGFRISKSQQVTDWEAAELSQAQMLYAATDAWVCHQIYNKLYNT
jgi:ribonuclease D